MKRNPEKLEGMERKTATLKSGSEKFTAVGRHQQTIKTQGNNVITKMLQEETEELKWKLEKWMKLKRVCIRLGFL